MSDAATFRAALTGHLDAMAQAGLTQAFWWRDDDAIGPSPALDRLLALANAHNVEIALAVIPKGATQALAERLCCEPRAVVLQHGWCHRNHQDTSVGEKAAELGSARPLSEVLDELAAGREKLEALFGEAFVPALVPPWNRITEQVASAARGIGLAGLSTFSSEVAYTPHRLQTHIDPIKWKRNNRFIGWASAVERFDDIFARRRAAAEPIGILSHHIVQADEHFAFLEETLRVTAHHRAARWPSVRTLFAL